MWKIPENRVLSSEIHSLWQKNISKKNVVGLSKTERKDILKSLLERILCGGVCPLPLYESVTVGGRVGIGRVTSKRYSCTSKLLGRVDTC